MGGRRTASAADHLRQQPAARRREEERRVGEAVVVGVLDLVAEAGRIHRRQQLAVAVVEPIAVVRLGVIALQQQERPGQRAVRQVAIGGAIDVGGGHDARVFAQRRDRGCAAERMADDGDLRALDPAASQRRRQRVRMRKLVDHETHVGSPHGLLAGHVIGSVPLARFPGADHPAVRKLGHGGLVGMVQREDDEAAAGEPGRQPGIDRAWRAIARRDDHQRPGPIALRERRPVLRMGIDLAIAAQHEAGHDADLRRHLANPVDIREARDAARMLAAHRRIPGLRDHAAPVGRIGRLRLVPRGAGPAIDLGPDGVAAVGLRQRRDRGQDPDADRGGRDADEADATERALYGPRPHRRQGAQREQRIGRQVLPGEVAQGPLSGRQQHTQGDGGDPQPGSPRRREQPPGGQRHHHGQQDQIRNLHRLTRLPTYTSAR
jgi:hypothetical protein